MLVILYIYAYLFNDTSYPESPTVPCIDIERGIADQGVLC
jgi:hypothetical protein